MRTVIRTGCAKKMLGMCTYIFVMSSYRDMAYCYWAARVVIDLCYIKNKTGTYKAIVVLLCYPLETILTGDATV